MEILKILLVSLILSIIPGQVLRIPFFLEYGALNLTDIIVIITDIFFVFYFLTIKRPISLSKKVFPAFAVFFTWAITANIFSLTIFDLEQTISSSLFLIRFLGYFFISQVILNIIGKHKVANWLNLIVLISLVFTIIGFFQLILFPDLQSLTVYGWDPHQKRIVSTFLDPNFAGLIFVFTFIVTTVKLIFHKKQKGTSLDKTYLYFLFISMFSTFAVIFTFSRSSYLALLTAVFIIGIIKSPKILFLTLFIISISFFVIPQVKNRIIGALTLDDTSQARIISWKNALTVLSNQPVFGVGFNNYRYAQEKYHLFNNPSQVELHSSSGSDSSILLVAATTGITGLVLFLLLITVMIFSVVKNIAWEPINLITTAVLFSLLVHSQFVNSFFFPQISLIFWTIFGLSQIKHD